MKRGAAARKKSYWDRTPPSSHPSSSTRGEQRSRFTDDQLTLLRAMAGRRKPSTADELVEETQIPARRVLSALTMLQVDGAVREHPGKRFSPLVELEG